MLPLLSVGRRPELEWRPDGQPPGRSTSLLGEPALQRQHVPERVLPVAAARQVLLPLAAHHGDVEESRVAQYRFAEKALAPLAQPAAQPLVDGDAKAHLASLRQARRHVPRENRAKEPL